MRDNIVLCLSTWCAIALSWIAFQVGRKHEGADPTRDEAYGIRPPRGLIRVEVVNNGWDADQEEHARAEQKHWRRSNWMYFAGTVITAFAAYGAFEAYRQAKRQADAADAGLRPWMAARPSVAGDLSLVEGKSRLHLRITLKNEGNGPAFGVAVHAEVRPYPSGKPAPLEENFSCASAKADGAVSVGRLFFPKADDPDPGGPWSFKTKDAVDAAAASPGGRFSLAVVGCVTYQMQGDDRIHLTPFQYDLYTPSPSDPDLRVRFLYSPGAVFERERIGVRDLYVFGRDPT